MNSNAAEDDACASDAVADDGADVDAGDQPPALLSTSPSSWKSRLPEISTLSCPRTPSIARCQDHKINKTQKIDYFQLAQLCVRDVPIY